ncbi:MAG: hypothetical protein VKJ06_05220 [Vampirovibrionales bacterium]|nr:hypothetical protein [Vampirovibrionales bacterium]
MMLLKRLHAFLLVVACLVLPFGAMQTAAASCCGTTAKHTHSTCKGMHNGLRDASAGTIAAPDVKQTCNCSLRARQVATLDASNVINPVTVAFFPDNVFVQPGVLPYLNLANTSMLAQRFVQNQSKRYLDLNVLLN